jgi:hypothetical protein
MTAPTLPPLPEPEIIDRHIPTNIVIRGYKSAQMRAYALQAIEDWKKAQVPASYQFQDRDGEWGNFLNDRHRQDTTEDGTWPIRSLYTLEQP